MTGYDPKNTKVHKLTERLIQNEIHLCVSNVVDRLLETDESLTEEYHDAVYAASKPCRVCDDCTGYDGDMDKAPEDCSDHIHPEVYEWYAISDSLARDLRTQGEVILDDCYGMTVWGRTVTGQAIILDGTMQKVAVALIARTGGSK